MPRKDKVLILHGWGGSDFPHWQSHLVMELAKDYGTVSFPLLDNCHFPSKNRWLKQLKSILEDFNPDSIVCHSLANTLWLWLCEDTHFMQNRAVQKLFMVSPPSRQTQVDTIKTFFPCPLPSTLYAKEVHIIVSDNDPYIKVNEAQDLADYYKSQFSIIKNAGHINADSGFGKWAEIEVLV
jgi:hypothetical protein